MVFLAPRENRSRSRALVVTAAHCLPRPAYDDESEQRNAENRYQIKIKSNRRKETTVSESSNRSIGRSWDKYDPVANAIAALAVAQDALQAALDASAGQERDGGTFPSDFEVDAAIDAALKTRANAIRELNGAQMVYWREHGEQPPKIGPSNPA